MIAGSCSTIISSAVLGKVEGSGGSVVIETVA